MKFDRWVGNTAGVVVFYIKHLVHWRGRRVDLHKFVRPDGWGRFHTHPAWAVRVILRGGYVEEVMDTETGRIWFRTWRPGMVGIVRPEFCHRLHRLRNGPSWSLWFRGKREHDIKLVGEGWPQNKLEGSQGNV